MSIKLEAPATARDWARARELVEEYAASLEIDLAFQGIAHELDALSQEYGPPAGAFLVAVEDGRALGCCGVRRIDAETGEVKRLYTAPAARGRGAGRLLAEAIVERARGLGYSRLLLDTLPSMTAARALYESLGFRPVPAYRFNPVEDAVFLELKLR